MSKQQVKADAAISDQARNTPGSIPKSGIAIISVAIEKEYPVSGKADS
jgi:hypothetical protein